MTLPSLPLELVAFITLELRLSCEDDSIRRSNGLAVALVCKRWTSLGEGIVWHGVVLDSASTAKSLVQHFDLHPHFAKAVRSLKITRDVDELTEEAPDEAEASLRRLWVVCEGVRFVEVWGVNWIPLTVAFSALARLEGVRRIVATLGSMNQSIFDTFAVLLASLPHLENLLCGISGEVPTDLSPPASLATTSLPLHSLMLVAPLAGGGGAELASSLLGCIDPTTLKFLTLSLGQHDSTLVNRLLSISSLEHLSFSPPPSSTDIGFFFSDFLPRLDRTKALYITLEPFYTPTADGSTSEALVLRSGTALTDLLSLLPPCIQGFSLKGYHLLDGPLPSPLDFEELATWSSTKWAQAATSVAMVKCGVRLTNGEVVEQRAFVGFPGSGKTMWRPSPANQSG
jgi:hypothetical protein